MKRDNKPTIRQVAEAAGVSPTTVSFVINGDQAGGSRISPETRQRVMDTIAELGYFPNQSARNLRKRLTERVCLAVNDLGIPYNSMLAKELNQVASEQGLMTIITVMGSAHNEQRTLDQLMRGMADGVIFISPSYLTVEQFARLAQTGCAVAISSNHLIPQGVDVVQNTEKDAAFTAMQYLYDKGHRRIAYVGQFSIEGAPYDRYEAYRMFMEGNALSINENYLLRDPGTSREQAYDKTNMLLSSPQLPTAIFAGSDLAAISAIYAIHKKGLRVPDDIAVIGSGNIPESKIIQPELTTIGPNKFELGALIDFLFSRMKGEAPPEGRLHQIEWNLIPRESA